MRTAIFLAAVCALSAGPAGAAVLDGNNGVDPTSPTNNWGWTAQAGSTIELAINLAPQQNDPNQIRGADLALRVTGPGSNLPMLSLMDDLSRSVDLIGLTRAGMLLDGGSQVGDRGRGTSNVFASAHVTTAHAFTQSAALATVDVTVPAGATPGLYTLDFLSTLWSNTATCVNDNNGTPFQNLTFRNGIIRVITVPEPSTWLLLVTGLTMAFAALMQKRILARR